VTILDSPDFTKSTYRERLVEYLLVGEILRHLWRRGVHNVEVLKPAVAHSGYDLVLLASSPTRSRVTGSTS
jgi:hypothetical protein